LDSDPGFPAEFVRRLRVFLSSPSDVTEERQIAREVIQPLQYEPQSKDEIDLEVVAWLNLGLALRRMALYGKSAPEALKKKWLDRAL
jgi:hypothetical protein